MQHVEQKQEQERERAPAEGRPAEAVQREIDRGVIRFPGERRVRLAPAAGPEVEALADDLSRAIEGEVRFTAGDRALYATDGSNYRQLPIGVVVPRHKDDVIAAIAACRRHGAPILARGGGTSLAGQTCNVAVVLDFSKYMRGVLALDPANKRARVLPGTVLDTLRNAANEVDLTFAPDPSTHEYCTLGGMIGNNSCGTHSVLGGRTADNVHELEVLTYDGLRLRVGPTSEGELDAIVREGGRRGRIYAELRAIRDTYADLIRARYPRIPRRVSGYNLDELLPENGFHVARALVGTEGTCVTVLEATLRLVDWPRFRSLLVLGYPDVFSAGDHVPEVMRFQPIALEGIDDRLIDDMHKKGLNERYLRYLPEGRGFLLAEFGGDTREEADARALDAMRALERGPNPPTMKLYDDPDQESALWEVRKSGLGATARVPGEPDTWPGWEDSAVHPDNLGGYLRDLRALFDRHGYQPALYGHFGQACVHCRVDFDVATPEGIRNWTRFLDEATDLVVRYGGSFSGEHGDGQARAQFLPKMYGEELIAAFRRFKAAWDPEWRMNPGKVVDPHRVDEDLRLGADFRPAPVETHFRFPDDDGDFTRATLRCVGVGKCRRHDGGTMCPSYRVTHEEEHTTRGRARLLFEMLEGKELQGFRDREVRESLDLCLACKGCKGECPVHVDMATYKAEFLSHYYAGRLRPRAAYTMGLIHWWARLGQLVPGLANLVTQTPALATVAKRIAGIAPERSIPPFARTSFRQWFQGRPRRNAGAPQVVLWPDTFNDHFFPETAIAATEVLEWAGYEVIVPEQKLCCGRPLYDFGFLKTARRMLRDVMSALRDPIERGVPVVGLEPSCVSVFRDELHGLFPDDPLATKLREQTHMFGDFLKGAAGGDPGRPSPGPRELPRLDRRAVVHGHCHHKAILEMGGERDVLRGMGLDVELLDSGCCGMAGAFGFEKGAKYEVSIRCGERVLLPAVRSAPTDALIVADGFSCREQIKQTTDRQALHLAQVVRMAALHGPEGPSGDYPERAYLPGPSDVVVTPRATLAAFAAAPAGAALLWAGGRRLAAERRRARRERWLPAAGVAAAALAAVGLLGRVAWRRGARSGAAKRAAMKASP
ncbi:FAD-linked oxidase C-terminal domain-containing protein [Sorangium sp. So ce448]|uniref:FAD-binding and (Fe-S)-binding domain-containing protein n=1 Tax=Sorangium sp. So ce448 TaxID=3133314 RepID=UPI003F5E632C